MGEDRTMCAEKKPNEVVSPCRHRHSSVISSCSEDAESESTSAGYPPSPDEEREEELEYGPGIVNKLRTRFLSITLKQTRGSNMRRSCSMENLLDQDRPLSRNFPSEKILDETDIAPARPHWGNLKRAKSMDTLLTEMNPGKDLHEASEVVKSGLVPIICDEELPKPDTVKIYKRMFEPAESRRGSNCRRPPVLRASARSSSGSKLVSSNPSAKVNGTSKNKFSAKQSTPVKAQSPDLLSNGSGKKSANGEPTRPLYNGCHVVKATPVKISNVRNGKEVDSLNSINRLLNKKEVHFAPKTDIICNGKGSHQEILKTKSNEEIVKQFIKSTISNGNMKPKVPPNRPSLKSPKPLIKTSDQTLSNVITPKSKPFFVNGPRKPCEINNKSDHPNSPVLKSPEPKLKDASKIPNFQIKDPIKSPPPETKLKDDFAWPPEQKSKDKAPLPPSKEDKPIVSDIQTTPESNTKIEATVPTPEKTIKDRIQILAESTAKDVMQPQGKDSIPKICERTCAVSPELNNKSDKTVKVHTVTPTKLPTMKPVNGVIEPIKKHINGFVDPGKKPTTESATEKSIVPSSSVQDNKLANGFTDLAKKITNDLTEPAKQTENGLAGPVKKAVNALADSPKQTSTGLANPLKQMSSGLTNSTNKIVNGLTDSVKKPSTGLSDPAKQPSSGLPDSAKKTVNGFSETATITKASKQPANDIPDVKRPVKKGPAQTTSMVFDFRGKDVVPHVAVLPVPFGCKALHPKKRSDDAAPDEDEDEDFVDYSVPPPSGVVFEGENVKIGRGSILATRNKDLKIKFDDDVDGNTFVYPSETSLLEEPERSPSSTNEVIPNGQPPPPSNSKLKTNTSIGSSNAGGLSTYTPSVLRTMDNFEPGMFRPPAPSPDKDPENRVEGEEENEEDLKPADPERISTWSLSTGTPDLLF